MPRRLSSLDERRPEPPANTNGRAEPEPKSTGTTDPGPTGERITKNGRACVRSGGKRKLDTYRRSTGASPRTNLDARDYRTTVASHGAHGTHWADDDDGARRTGIYWRKEGFPYGTGEICRKSVFAPPSPVVGRRVGAHALSRYPLAKPFSTATQRAAIPPIASPRKYSIYPPNYITLAAATHARDNGLSGVRGQRVPTPVRGENDFFFHPPPPTVVFYGTKQFNLSAFNIAEYYARVPERLFYVFRSFPSFIDDGGFLNTPSAISSVTLWRL